MGAGCFHCQSSKYCLARQKAAHRMMIGDGKFFEADLNGLLDQRFRRKLPVGVQGVHVEVEFAGTARLVNGFEDPPEVLEHLSAMSQPRRLSGRG